MSLKEKPKYEFPDTIVGATTNQPSDWNEEELKARLLALSSEKDRILIERRDAEWLAAIDENVKFYRGLLKQMYGNLASHIEGKIESLEEIKEEMTQ